MKASTLARVFTSFWNDTIPFCDVLVADINKNLQVTFENPLISNVDSSRRALINEVGYELFRVCAKSQTDIDVLFHDSSTLAAVLATVRSRVSRFAVTEGLELSDVERKEVFYLGQRLLSFFRSHHPTQEIQTLVPLAGCGWLESCEIDVLVNRTLYEIKGGDRSYLGTDIRQVLIYLAANSEAHKYVIDSVCLLNPRRGTFCKITIDDLCVRSAGAGQYDVINSITNLLSTSYDYA